ncbi:possible Histidine triad (HIT) protein [Oceanicola granulosus HTCC2516]|uniref:Possible Histidine triad (HIT) protein n=1 Tax=Oceanicola granulosus (strain ATCC BAA-861 / DSM 15982 / KCTC 12143 / HTCC2516) TaxID=314256 RepID=Q2CB64_OCEGH|nr:histidine triad nucleotide-binding protein [Oceanicola granulosus]EAR49921.1 possible Histidine triad (HIT) protein [Oceanicola granulosus HTCC2516]
MEAYDPDNIFAKLLRGEIPCDKVMETEHSLAFRDIRPQAPTHVLVIPKGAYASLDVFCQTASEAEIVDFMRTVGEVCRQQGVEEGFRLIANARTHGVQEVPHLHVHILAGRRLGPMLSL